MSDIDRRSMIAGASIIGAVALARAAKGGQLLPPNGPVQATGRSLRDVEPRTPMSSVAPGSGALHEITVAGSYFLTDNIDVPAGMDGIVIKCNGPVAIDMRGFSIRGAAAGSGRGVAVSGFLVDCYLEVFDGFIRDLDGDGIDGGQAGTLEVDDVHVLHCAQGVRKALGRMKCSDVTLERCAGHGFHYEPSGAPPGAITALECIIDDCEASECGGCGVCIDGDYSGVVCTVWIADCDLQRNGLDGCGCTFGGTAGLSGNDMVSITIDECDCSGNGRDGIAVECPVNPIGLAVGCVLECSDCTCALNGAEGMRVRKLRAAICDGDAARNAGSGMSLTDVTGSVECCLCVSNGLDGLTATNVQGVIDEVDCLDNGRDGMNCAGGSGSITACECSSNVRKGKVFTNQFDCDLCEDITRLNGQGGIHIDATCARMCVADCAAYSTGTGFLIEGSSILLIRNTASGNTANYAFDPVTNPTVVVSPSDLAASCNPHANYAF